MFSNKMQLACALLFITLIHSVQCQASSTATENGIVSAAGGPEPTQSVSYIIEGTNPTSTITSIPHIAATQTSTSIDGSDVYSSRKAQDRLSVPAVIGTTLAIILAVAGIVFFSVYVHKKRREMVARQQRRTIMDAEFTPSREKLPHIEPSKYQQKPLDAEAKIGYFDIAKPLPAVTQEPIEDDRLSRSSTIIADAAEIAKINRKACTDQEDAKTQRSTTRSRNHALQALVGTADCGDSKQMLPPLPRSQSSTKPMPAYSGGYPTECTDGNGDPFMQRVSKI